MTTPRLSTLRNLGPRSIAMLDAIGIRTCADLTACGAIDAYIACRCAGQPATLNLCGR